MKVVSGLIEALENAGYMETSAPESNCIKSVYFPLYSAGAIQRNLYFTPDPSLNGENCTITSIEVVDVVTSPGFVSGQQSRDNMAITILKNGYITISDRDRQEFAQVPLVQMVSRLNKGRKFLCEFNEQQWDNCYIEFGSTASLSSAVGIQLVVHYKPKN